MPEKSWFIHVYIPTNEKTQTAEKHKKLLTIQLGDCSSGRCSTIKIIMFVKIYSSELERNKQPQNIIMLCWERNVVKFHCFTCKDRVCLFVCWFIYHLTVHSVIIDKTFNWWCPFFKLRWRNSYFCFCLLIIRFRAQQVISQCYGTQMSSHLVLSRERKKWWAVINKSNAGRKAFELHRGAIP